MEGLVVDVSEDGLGAGVGLFAGGLDLVRIKWLVRTRAAVTGDTGVKKKRTVAKKKTVAKKTVAKKAVADRKSVV